MRINANAKSVTESLGLYIKNHVQYADQLIQDLTNKLCLQDFSSTLIDYDRQLLKSITQISLTYCIATNNLNRYPDYLNREIELEKTIINLAIDNLRFNQRIPLAQVMNSYISNLKDMLANGQTIEKLKIIFHLFRLSFSVDYFYQITNDVHNKHLEVINNAH